MDECKPSKSNKKMVKESKLRKPLGKIWPFNKIEILFWNVNVFRLVTQCTNTLIMTVY